MEQNLEQNNTNSNIEYTIFDKHYFELSFLIGTLIMGISTYVVVHKIGGNTIQFAVIYTVILTISFLVLFIIALVEAHKHKKNSEVH